MLIQQLLERATEMNIYSGNKLICYTFFGPLFTRLLHIYVNGPLNLIFNVFTQVTHPLSDSVYRYLGNERNRMSYGTFTLNGTGTGNLTGAIGDNGSGLGPGPCAV